MKSIITVVSYTITEAVKRKAFIVSTIIMMVIIVLATNIPNIITLFQGEESVAGEKIMLIGEPQILDRLVITEEESEALGYEFEINPVLSREELEIKVKEEGVFAGVVVHLENGIVSFEYMTNQSGMYASYNVDVISSLLKSIQVGIELEKIHAPESTIASIITPITYEIVQLGEEANQNFLIAMVASFVLFFAVYFYGFTVSSSVSSEKTSRVMETLITSTNPTTIVIGKTIGMGIVGLGQMLSLVIVGVVSYKIFVPESFELIKELLGGTNVGVGPMLLLFCYFVLGYMVYAFLNAVTGATVSKAEDVQAANSPIAFISLGSFYLAYFTATMPNSGASKFASMFPFSAAFSMPGRVLAGGVAAWEVVLSLAILTATAIALAFVSIKIYSAAILHYGNRLKLSDLAKLFKSKE